MLHVLNAREMRTADENTIQKKRESVTEKILQQQKKIDRLEQEKNEKSTNYIKNVTGN